MSSDSDPAPHWELYKENAAPLERGRDVKKLSNALTQKSSGGQAQRQEDDPNIRSFERQIRPSEKFATMYSGSEKSDEGGIEDMLVRCKVDKDPLVHWLRYIKYHEESYPSDTHSQFLLKERCVMSLLNHPKYTNDVRYIRVCVLYADGTDDPHGQFKFFHKHKLGSQVAIFWLAWAWVAEKKNDFPFADKIFQKAIQKKAKPEKIVNQRYKQFQRRMSRHWLNANANNPESVYDEEEDASQNNRAVLHGLTEEGVRQNHRGIGVNSIAQRENPERNSQSNQNSRDDNNNASSVPNAKEFQIFADENEEEGRGYELNQSPVRSNEGVPLPRMVKQDDRRKENTQEAEAWNQRGGLHGHYQSATDDRDDRISQSASSVVSRWAGTGGDSITAGGTSSQPAFQVFVDEDCVEKEETTKPRKHMKLSERSLKKHSDGVRELPLSIRSSSGITTKGSMRARVPSRPSQTKDSREIPTDAKLKPKKSTISTVFEKVSVNNNVGEREMSFEEKRAKLRYSKNRRLVPTMTNFNLLHKMDNSRSESPNSSCMDIDDGSTVEEVDIEDNSCSMNMIREDEESVNQSIMQNRSAFLNSKKVLFANNTSFSNSSVNRANNTSTTSSNVDEKDAVGVVGDREETLNTKFAARELSMMFSSPAGFMNQSTALSSKKTSEKLLFSIHHDVDESNISSNGSTEGATNLVEGRDGAFAIFCDDKENVGDAKKNMKPSGFAIYEESESDDDSFEDGERIGDTASLADIEGIMNDTSLEKQDNKGDEGNNKTSSGGFAIFCDDARNDRSIENGTVLTEDTAAFGDLSFIPSSDGDTCNLQDKMKRISLL